MSVVAAFIESNATYNRGVKLGIAAVLIPLEEDHRLVDKAGGDWMGYLFEKILPANPTDLHLN
jgi:hypothetical protein